ncbi:MFS transporter [Brucella intermedia]|uniref:MFS transporter n=1 Tax=Brucella intermedia TaxID=94625 RepID=UPI00224B5FCB|nr:MFS transporter [Brucella intermedia]
MQTQVLPDKNKSKRTVLSGWIGSVFEYYDFFIYATASALVFPQIFFPSQNPHIAIVISLATYGVGYVMRPVGAFILGHIGDTKGRKTVLLLCLYLMGFATVAVGLLPTYDQIGLWAPILLVTLRLVQGFAVAGEIVGASSMILESAPEGKRGFYTSFALQGVQVGQIVAAAVFLPLAHFLSDSDFLSWGWRIPFLASILIILISSIIRRKVSESPVFLKEQNQGEKVVSPIKEAVQHSSKDMIRVGVMSTMNAVAATISIFGAAYAVQPAYGIGFDKDFYLWIPIVGNLIAIVTTPLAGKLSDKVGRRPPIIVGALVSGALVILYLYFVSTHNMIASLITAILIWGFFYQGYNGTYSSFFPELFKARYRVSAMAVAFNCGVALSAALPSLFAMIAYPGSEHIPLKVGGMIFGLTILVALCAWFSRETFRTPTALLGEVDPAR